LSPWGAIAFQNETSSASGIGKETGIKALRAYSNSRSICLNLTSMENRRKDEDWFGFVEREREGGATGVMYG